MENSRPSLTMAFDDRVDGGEPDVLLTARLGLKRPCLGLTTSGSTFVEPRLGLGC